MTSRVVTENRAASRSKKEDLRPRLTLLDAESGEAARYMLAPGTTLSVEDGQSVEAGDILARASREAAKTRDITGGLPRVAELFEARKPKDNSIIAKIAGRIEFVRDYKAKRKIAIIPEEGDPVEYLIPKSRVIDVQEGDWVKKGDNLISGSPDPHDILEVLGIEPLAEYLVAEIQEVYRLQGVKINDKHIEVIVRQMLQKVEITDGGDTTLLAAEQVDREEMDEINAKLAPGQAPAEGKPVLLGITKASLQTRSFISAASFQETTRVLTQAAVEGKKDSLIGLKENVIVGRLIPAGTGAGMNRLRVAAISRDAALRAQYRKLQESLIAPATAAEEHAAELAQGPKRRSVTMRWQASRAKPTASMPMRVNTSTLTRPRATQRSKLYSPPNRSKRRPRRSDPAGFFATAELPRRYWLQQVHQALRARNAASTFMPDERNQPMTPDPAVLFQPLTLGSMQLKNRIVMAPMTRGFAAQGQPGPAHADYYRLRAEGECGLILTEGTVVDRPASRNEPGIPFFHGPALDGWGEVVTAVHGAGGAIAPQIWHSGSVKSMTAGDWEPETPVESPSALIGPGLSRGTAMSEADIADTVAAFARAAADAKALGFDAVEVHGAHGYLIDQFFWAGTNLRDDRYGGPTLRSARASPPKWSRRSASQSVRIFR